MIGEIGSNVGVILAGIGLLGAVSVAAFFGGKRGRKVKVIRAPDSRPSDTALQQLEQERQALLIEAHDRLTTADSLREELKGLMDEHNTVVATLDGIQKLTDEEYAKVFNDSTDADSDKS